MENLEILHTNPTKTKYYLIPTDHSLPPGDYTIRTLTGRERQVDPASVTAFEVSKVKARRHMRRQARALWGEIKQAHNLPDIKPVSLLTNPRRTAGLLREAYRAVREIMVGVSSDDPVEQETARKRMRIIRERLQAHGVKVNESVERLPDRLRERYQAAGKQAELAESAAALDQVAAELGPAMKGEGGLGSRSFRAYG